MEAETKIMPSRPTSTFSSEDREVD